MSKKLSHWAAPGDVNAFFGLMLDNIADLLLTVSLLAVVFGFPTSFALRYMIPGTAIGVLLGDLLFFWMAISLARRTGRDDVTAMPLGLDTPSSFGMVFFVLGPAFLHAQNDLGMAKDAAAVYTWHIGIWSIVFSGVLKLALSCGCGWIRRVVPRAGLLGSLAAIALVLITFMPLLEILHFPVVGMIALAIVLTTLVARIRFPGRIPGALAALLVAGTIYYLMQGFGLMGHAPAGPALDPSEALWPHEWLGVFRFGWLAAFGDSLHYLPIVIPFALGTVVGGIDCVESAAACGDEYDTGRIIAVEGLATLVAGICGGVIQTTPYIGHPAYKAMGGRSAYTLATALFVGGAGLIGYFGYLYAFIPKATVYPILVFIGLEITSQSFQVTPKRHYPAIALACVPALAALVLIYIDKIIGDPVIAARLSDALRAEVLTIRILASGFIVTSLLWASALASIIDRRLLLAGIYLSIAAGCSLLGIIHSPQPGSPLALPWNLPPELASLPVRYFAGYLSMAGLLAIWGLWLRAEDREGKVE